MKTYSLQQRFSFWTLVLVLLPSLLIMGIYTAGQISIARQQSVNAINERVSSQERLIDYWVAERSNEVLVLSQLQAFRTLDLPNMNQILTTFCFNNDRFDSFSYIDKDGIFQLSTLASGIQYRSTVDQPYFQAALAGNEYISDVVIGRNSGQALMNFSAPVFDTRGNFQGLILGSVKTSQLESLLRDNWIGQTGEIFLVNREGVMLTEPRFLNQLIESGRVQNTAKMKYKISPDTLRQVRLGTSGSATGVNYLGHKVLGAYLDVPSRGWTLIGQIDESEVLTPIYWQLATMAGSTLILLLLIFPLANRITHSIQKPIDWLLEQVQLLQAGKYRQLADTKGLKNIPHELNALCETFVEMSRTIARNVILLRDNEAKLASKLVEIQNINTVLEDQIADRQAAQIALQHINAQLETRVSQRTIELQDLNALLEEEITSRKASQQELRVINQALVISEARYRGLFRHMQDAFFICKVIVDAEGNPVNLEYVDINPAFQNRYGFRMADVVGRLMTDVFPGITEESLNWIKIFGDVGLTGNPILMEEYFESGGKWLRLEAYCPEEGYVAGVTQDITDTHRSKEQLKHYSDELSATNTKLMILNDELRRISLSDGLTGIANRRYFDEYLEREWQRAKREGKPLALVMIDVDYFKLYNDTYGHIAGDECLKTIASMLKVLPKRPTDIAARYGGEEFALVLPNTNEVGAFSTGEKVRSGVEKMAIAHHASAISRLVTVSVGVAVHVPAQHDLTSMIMAAADQALYQAKMAGRNQVKLAPAPWQD